MSIYHADLTISKIFSCQGVANFNEKRCIFIHEISHTSIPKPIYHFSSTTWPSQHYGVHHYAKNQTRPFTKRHIRTPPPFYMVINNIQQAWTSLEKHEIYTQPFSSSSCQRGCQGRRSSEGDECWTRLNCIWLFVPHVEVWWRRPFRPPNQSLHFHPKHSSQPQQHHRFFPLHHSVIQGRGHSFISSHHYYTKIVIQGVQYWW